MAGSRGIKGKQLADNSINLVKLSSGIKLLTSDSKLGINKTPNEITDPKEYITKEYADSLTTGGIIIDNETLIFNSGFLKVNLNTSLVSDKTNISLDGTNGIFLNNIDISSTIITGNSLEQTVDINGIKTIDVNINGIDNTHIDFGTSGNQVNSTHIPTSPYNWNTAISGDSIQNVLEALDNDIQNLSTSGNGSSLVTASNGLTKTGDDISLGGILVENITIDGNENDFFISNTNNFGLDANIISLTGGSASSTIVLDDIGISIIESSSNNGIRIEQGGIAIYDNYNSNSLSFNSNGIEIIDTNSNNITSTSTGIIIETNDATDTKSINLLSGTNNFGIVVTDTNGVGLVNSADYTTKQLLNDRAITDVGGVKQLITSNSGVFTSDIEVILSGGKNVGRYVNGDIIPSSGKTPQQVITLISQEYLLPVATSFSISGQATTVEVGSSISGSKTFTWVISNPSNVVTNTCQIVDINGGNGTIAIGLANDSSEVLSVSPINPVIKTTETSNTWRFQFEDLEANINQRDFVVNWRYLFFYGVSTTTLSNSVDVRALPQNIFRTTSSFILNTGTTLTKFYITIPLGRILTSVIDLDALNANITSSYVEKANILVNDGGGTPVSYRVYEAIAGVPYASNHKHQIIIS